MREVKADTCSQKIERKDQSFFLGIIFDSVNINSPIISFTFALSGGFCLLLCCQSMGTESYCY